MTTEKHFASDLSTLPDAFRAVKVPTPVAVSFAAQGGVLQTLEGPVTFASADAIVTGGAGERWPVPRARFMSTYEPVAPTTAWQDGTYCQRPSRVWALRVTEPLYVTLPDQRGTLHAKNGDVIMQYAVGDLAIVRADVFSKTYRILGSDESTS